MENYDITHLSADGAAPLLSIRKGGGFMEHKETWLKVIVVLVLATLVDIALSLIVSILALI